jgi:hypothetical protein
MSEIAADRLEELSAEAGERVRDAPPRNGQHLVGRRGWRRVGGGRQRRDIGDRRPGGGVDAVPEDACAADRHPGLLEDLAREQTFPLALRGLEPLEVSVYERELRRDVALVVLPHRPTGPAHRGHSTRQQAPRARSDQSRGPSSGAS